MLYPIGMICLLWMPSTLQFVWLSYQLYVSIAMHAYRYGGGDLSCSIQEAIGNALLVEESAGIVLQSEANFVLTATLAISVVKSVNEGREVMAELMRGLAGETSPRSSESADPQISGVQVDVVDIRKSITV